MNDNKINLDPNNIDFSKLKLIGYYKSASPKLNIESININEASDLAKLLNKSFYAAECIASLNTEFYRDLIRSVLIFKNFYGHLFAYLPITGTARITDVKFNRKEITIPPEEYKTYFTPGKPFGIKQTQLHQSQTPKKEDLTKVKLDVIRVVKKEGLLYYEVSYCGILCYIRLYPFQVEFAERGKIKKQIVCVYQGLDEHAIPRLAQDRETLVDELYEEDTVHSFSYIRTEVDYHSNTSREYHLMRDGYGLKHRLYAELPKEQKVPGTKVEVYVHGINKKNKTLILSLFNPKIDRIEKFFYSADKVFEEIGEKENKEQFFDCYFNADEKHSSKLQRDLVGQYNGESNLWLFTYMNILDTDVIKTCIRKHQLEELTIVCKMMIKLQEWMVEGSTFLDLFSEETKATTITKSTAQILKFNRLLLAIDVVRKGKQNEYIGDIVSSIQKSGRIAIRREERIEVMIDILRLYPEYFTQDLESTSQLFQALLNVDEGVGRFEIEFLASRLDYYIEADVRKMRSGYVRSNEIDTTQTLLINEVLALVGMKVMIHTCDKYANELDARTCKARFFRFLSFVCSEDMQPTMIKAGIDALVGVIDGSSIFTWENVTNINPIPLCNLTAQATVLDCNTDNDFYFMKSVGKTGIIRLDPTGFTIVPYKQCMTNYKMDSEFMDAIKIIHHLETLPIKLGTMFNVTPPTMNSDAVEQYLLWRAISKHPEELGQGLDLPKPQIGDKVRVYVKEQNQPDKLKNLLFVSVVDKRYSLVEGVLTPKDISGKWMEDTRKVFKAGQVFYAEVCNITKEGKYQFSVRKDVDKYATNFSSVEDDLKHILGNSESISELSMLPKSFVQELLLLVDMRIRKESNPMNRLMLIGYAYCLSALVSDPKSYYYDFLLRYYAAIDKFITNEHKDVIINFHDTINSKFANIETKRRLVELLSYASSQDKEGLQVLHTLAEESENDAGKLAAMLIAYIYAMKAGFSAEVMVDLKNEINDFVGNSDKLDLSALNSEEEDADKADETEFEEKEDVQEIKQDEVAETSDELPVIDNFTTKAEEMPEPLKQTPLKLNIFDDGSLIVTEDTPRSESLSAVVEISIPIYAFNGVVLLVNNEGGISKISVQEIANADLKTKYDSKVNPYKLSNHFVVPTECIVGTVITTINSKYIEVYNTVDMLVSNFLQPDYKRNEEINVLRHQPFILPDTCEIPGLDRYFNRCVESKEISETIVEGLKSYGIFI
jgi:hypothetical protein